MSTHVTQRQLVANETDLSSFVIKAGLVKLQQEKSFKKEWKHLLLKLTNNSKLVFYREKEVSILKINYLKSKKKKIKTQVQKKKKNLNIKKIHQRSNSNLI